MSFKTLSTVRRVLEPELAYIAASTANEEDIERIKQPMKEWKRRQQLKSL